MLGFPKVKFNFMAFNQSHQLILICILIAQWKHLIRPLDWFALPVVGPAVSKIGTIYTNFQGICQDYNPSSFSLKNKMQDLNWMKIYSV